MTYSEDDVLDMPQDELVKRFLAMQAWLDKADGFTVVMQSGTVCLHSYTPWWTVSVVGVPGTTGSFWVRKAVTKNGHKSYLYLGRESTGSSLAQFGSRDKALSSTVALIKASSPQPFGELGHAGQAWKVAAP